MLVREAGRGWDVDQTDLKLQTVHSFLAMMTGNHSHMSEYLTVMEFHNWLNNERLARLNTTAILKDYCSSAIAPTHTHKRSIC